jgi:hypothetical protein
MSFRRKRKNSGADQLEMIAKKPGSVFRHYVQRLGRGRRARVMIMIALIGLVSMALWVRGSETVSNYPLAVKSEVWLRQAHLEGR